MALLLNLKDVSKSFGAVPLFEAVSLTIHEKDRLGMIGPNGAGKSTLLQILAGLQPLDAGIRSARKSLRIGYVPQEPAFTEGETVGQFLLPETSGRAGFAEPAALASSLSGGWRKRLAIARELSREPDLLLLDEPTNHLDIEGIEWLENSLAQASFASVVVSHDRYFLESVATSMAEVSRQYPGGLLRVNGNYSDFLVRREDLLTAQAKQQESLANRVKTEVEWLRRGAKARSTKSKARIDAAGRLMDELSAVTSRNQTATARIDFQGSDRKTKKLVELTAVSKQIAGRELFRDLHLRLTPGRRVGLVGANATGKSTLLKLITGELLPDAGEIFRAEGVRVVYFDQNRAQLDPEVSLRRTLVPRGDSVIFGDRPVHIMSWAKRFLFLPEQLDMPVGRLSGGEQARVLIAKLMLEPADVLLLDEPTNDLDLPTLEVLEDNLAQFPGALVLVTHDRYLLDRVSNAVIGLDGEGGAGLYANLQQWQDDLASRPPSGRVVSKGPAPAAETAPKKKLSYLESREWQTIEERIASAEAALHGKQKRLDDPLVNTDHVRLTEATREWEDARREVDQLYARWAELEAKLA